MIHMEQSQKLLELKSKVLISDIERIREEYEKRKQRYDGSEIYTYANPANLFSIQSRQKVLSKIIIKHDKKNLKQEKILEMGCGKGSILTELLQFETNPNNLFGIDLLIDRLKEAKNRLPSSSIINADGQFLPFKSESVDLIFQYTAFSSVLDGLIKNNIASEIMHVLKPGGLIVWYDFWLNPTNKQTKGIRKKEIKALFPNCTYDFHKITLAPPIARRLVPVSWILCMILEKLKIFNTHYLVAIKKK
jgi:ubiquinone/menaquinone biosynthesis C-methylase UbiE